MNPRVVNEVRVGVNYVWTSGGDHKDGVGNFAEQLGIQDGNDRGPGLMGLEGSLRMGVGSSNTPRAALFADTVIQVEDGMVITQGRHILHTGFQYWRQRINTFLAVTRAYPERSFSTVGGRQAPTPLRYLAGARVGRLTRTSFWGYRNR